jgi:hypothetical protein
MPGNPDSLLVGYIIESYKEWIYKWYIIDDMLRIVCKFLGIDKLYLP